MEKHCENEKRFGKEGGETAAERLDGLAEKLLMEARVALQIGGGEARRQIVRTALHLERMLGEVRP